MDEEVNIKWFESEKSSKGIKYISEEIGGQVKWGQKGEFLKHTRENEL